MKEKGLEKRRAARKKYARVEKSSKPGSGKRFSALADSIQAEGKSKKQADAIDASIGRKKYGAGRMAKMAARGRKK